MQTLIQSRGFSLTSALREYTIRRLLYAISFASDRIHRVTVHLSDINGPRGGNDKRCQLIVTMDKLPSVVIEDTENDLYAAIDRATQRAGRSVARHLKKIRNQRGNSRRAGVLIDSTIPEAL